jgi:hypothetical protein
MLYLCKNTTTPQNATISDQTAAAKKVTINSKFVFPQRQNDKETHNTA